MSYETKVPKFQSRVQEEILVSPVLSLGCCNVCRKSDRKDYSVCSGDTYQVFDFNQCTGVVDVPQTIYDSEQLGLHLLIWNHLSLLTLIDQ